MTEQRRDSTLMNLRSFFFVDSSTVLYMRLTSILLHAWIILWFDGGGGMHCLSRSSWWIFQGHAGARSNELLEICPDFGSQTLGHPWD